MFDYGVPTILTFQPSSLLDIADLQPRRINTRGLISSLMAANVCRTLPAVHRCLVKSAVYTAISCVTIRGHVESATTRCLPRRGYPGNFKDGISQVRPSTWETDGRIGYFWLYSGRISIIIWTWIEIKNMYFFY